MKEIILFIATLVFYFLMWWFTSVRFMMKTNNSDKEDAKFEAFVVGGGWPIFWTYKMVTAPFRFIIYSIDNAKEWQKRLEERKTIKQEKRRLRIEMKERKENFIDEPGISYRSSPKKESR